MLMKLHGNATTTPRLRAYIQASDKSVAVLARELGVSETTIRRWKARRDTVDRPTRDCQDFRVRAGIMGTRSSPYVTTQRTDDTE